MKSYNERSPGRKVLWLILALCIAGLFLYPFSAHAATQEVTTTKYKLDTGVIFIWCNAAGEWQQGKGPGSFYVLPASTYIGTGKKNIQIMPYTSGNFQFDHKDYAWNKTEKAYNESTYNNHYVWKAAAVQKAVITNYDASTGNLSFSTNNVLVVKDGIPYDVVETLKLKGKQEILDLVGEAGGKDLENFMNETDFAEPVQGQLYFVPTVISWEETVIQEVPDPVIPLELVASLSVPSTGVTGELYPVKDETILPVGGEFLSSTMERNDGTGWTPVLSWNGSSLGEQIQEVSEQDGSIQYKLTVNLKSGEKDVDIQSIDLSHRTVVEAECHLALPDHTYEGHPTPVEDQSIYHIDGQSYSALRAYAEGKARNGFALMESGVGTVKKDQVTPIYGTATFSTKGTYHVQLKITPKNSSSLFDTKPIQVRKTPTVMVRLGGVQKQNRKQTLDIQVATNPAHPLTALSATLTNQRTGESVTLHHQLSVGSNTAENSGMIKTRAIEDNGSNGCFTLCTLPFLTKDAEVTDYHYQVYAKDRSGNWDRVEKDFTVKPDTPPHPKIAVQDRFFREKGSNVAVLEMEDRSESDGDSLQRSWYLTEDGNADDVFSQDAELPAVEKTGYMDCAFGTKKLIQVHKTGVGKVRIRLQVKDVWTEETLPEYITDADYLWAETTAETMVDNIAPIVSLKPLSSKTAQILLLGAGESAFQQLNETINEMQSIFLGNAIDGDCLVRRVNRPLHRSYPMSHYTIGQPFGYGGRDTGFENRCYLVDERRLYTLEGTWHVGANYWNSYVTAPYTLRAFDADNNREPVELWRATVYDDSAFSLSPGDFQLAQDDSDQYLYLISGGKTLWFTKDNGTRLTTIPFAMGTDNFVMGDNVYTFRQDGIYSIHRKSGAIRAVWQGAISLPVKKIQGNVEFAWIQSLQLKRGCFDLKTNQVYFENLGLADRSGYQLRGMDSNGLMVLTSEDRTDSRRVTCYVRVYDGSNQLVHTRTVYLGSNGNSITPVLDSNGVCHYLAWLSSGRSSNYYHCGAQLVGISNGVATSCDVSSKGKLTTDRMLFTTELPTGEVYLISAANYLDTDAGYGTYPERAKAFVYDPSSGSLYAKKNGLLGGVNYVDEYSQESSLFLATHYGDNSRNQEMAESVTTIIKKPKTLDQMLYQELNRDLQSNRQLRAVGFYDDGQGEGWTPELLQQTKQKLQQEGYAFFVLTPNKGGASLPWMADQLGATVIQSDAPLQEMARMMVEREKGEQVLLLESAKQEGTFQRQTALPAGTRYYYEYQMKANGKSPVEDLFQANLAMSPLGNPGSIDAEDTCHVSEVINESFDYETHPMLQLGSTAAYDAYDHYNQSGFISKTMEYGDSCHYPPGLGRFYGVRLYRNYENSTTIKFDVPQGKKAILSFDYMVEMNASNRNTNRSNAYINVNGNSTRCMESDLYGDYMYKSYGRYQAPVLSQGEQTMTLTMSSNRRRGDTGFFLIDNLQLILIDTDGSKQGQQESHMTPGESGWTTVKGHFDTPGDIAYYGALRYGNSFHPQAFTYQGKTYVPAATFSKQGAPGFRLKEETAYTIRNVKLYSMVLGQPVYHLQEVFNRQGVLDSFRSDKVMASLTTAAIAEDRESLIYKKGEWIRYGIHYLDYEEDPSKAEYWRYTHTPFNDGAHPLAAIILNENGTVRNHQPQNICNKPIDRFYVDGKYTVEHWQYDDTTRKTKPGGNPLYDKSSNVEKLTFYIQGGAMAPWITSIQTIPSVVKEGKPMWIEVGVDDAEKDPLGLTTEVYRNKKLIYTHHQNGICGDGAGMYPKVVAGPVQSSAVCGKYEVVCTVRDQTGAGMGSYHFYVVTDGKITGKVHHTDLWDQNRKKYNLKWFQDEIQRVVPYVTYMKQKEPRRRGTNVFWSGEKFMVRGDVAGSPEKVTCGIEGTSYSVRMHGTGKRNGNKEMMYEGILWDKAMINQWGRKKPKELTFLFKAFYEGGTVKTDKVQVIVDSKQDYWQLHRLF